jgi:hypothetical protein
MHHSMIRDETQRDTCAELAAAQGDTSSKVGGLGKSHASYGVILEMPGNSANGMWLDVLARFDARPAIREKK